MTDPAKPDALRRLAVENLVAILDLEQIEQNIYRGRVPDVGWQRVFGGLVISQALVAATRTVDGKTPHSLHGYFLLPGDPSVPIVYQVDRIRDGSSFATRRCVAVQHGRAIFSLSASYHVEESGFEHQAAMPDVPPPDKLLDPASMLAAFGDKAPENIRRYFERPQPIQLRPVDVSRYFSREKGRPAIQHYWVRAASKLPDDPAIHRAVLAYLSDMTLLDTSLAPHGESFFTGRMQMASLDHSMWLHRPFRADEWLLYTQDSPSAQGARGFSRGSLYTRDGVLVASTTQEGLIRPHDAAKAKR